MTRRLLLLGVILAAGWIAVWLIRSQRKERTRGPESAFETDIERRSVTAALEPVSLDDDGPTAKREPANGSRMARRESGTSETVTPRPVDDRTIATLSVRTVDRASGAVVPRVRVTLYLRPGGKPVRGDQGTSAWTGDGGQAVFELEPGVPYYLSASGDREDVGDGEADIAALAGDEFREVVVTLPTGTDLHFFGQVRARGDETPVAGASVELLDAPHFWIPGRPTPPERVLSTITADAGGFFELSLSSWKARDLRIRAAGFYEARVRATEAHETRDEARVFHLYRPASLRARIVDASGAPLPEASVHLTGEVYPSAESGYGENPFERPPDQEWQVLADPSGLCTFEALPSEALLSVEILQRGAVVSHDIPALTLSPGEAREVTWSVGTGCRIEGQVVEPDGTAVPDLEVWGNRTERDGNVFFQEFQHGATFTARTDAQGRFAFADVAAGQWWIAPAAVRRDDDEADPRGIAPITQVVEVHAGDTRTAVCLVVQRGLYIRGRVLDSAGKAAPRIHVMAWTDDSYQATNCRADGAFAVGPLVPGRYGLRAYSDTDADSRRVEASAGDEGVELRLQHGGMLSGTVVDGATGMPCAARLTLSCTVDGRPRSETGGSDDDGTFRVQGLAEGTYDLTACAGDSRCGVLRGVSVAGGKDATDLAVTLSRGATLRLGYAGKSGYLFYEVRCNGVLIRGDGVAAGEKKETAVPAGHLVIECEWRGGSETKEIDLDVGKDAELVFGSDGG
jgi:hypothetical protein